jgi:transcriptional regulator with XRE-family HTH domain
MQECMPEGGRMESASRQRVAAELRRMREGLGIPGEAVATALGENWSQSKLSRIENGRISVSVRDLADLLSYYDVPEDVRAELLSVTAAETGMDGAWIVRAGNTPRRQGEVGAIESRLQQFSQYQSVVVPGQLQSPGYTREVVRRGGFPHPEEVVRKRRQRQAILEAPDAPAYVATIDARAFVTCPTAELPALLTHVAERAALPTLTLRVIPLGAEAQTVVVTPFILYEFREESSPPVVFVESQTADLYLSSQADVQRYTELFDHLTAEALEPDETLDYLPTLAATVANLRSARTSQ